ncbi:leucine-rich repeat domain-containing protein [Metamycoplasma spumans]|uniref:leucine-rich repeat domain-containing protein n=1 Tax=Metamycoplasma spumans TaxID=92406 RepID=UPI0034DCFC64
MILLYRLRFKNADSNQIDILKSAYQNITYFNIGSSSFSNAIKLSDVHIPLVTQIPDNTFYANRSLTSVFAPKVKNIGSYAFFGASSLSSIELPEVTNIENYAFANAINLSSVTAPKLERIGTEVFKNTNIPNDYVIGKVTIRN